MLAAISGVGTDLAIVVSEALTDQDTSRNIEMNILMKIGTAIDSVNTTETEASAMLGFFGRAAEAAASRNAPAYGSFSRRRARRTMN